jgi:hypothetical protein
MFYKGLVLELLAKVCNSKQKVNGSSLESLGFAAPRCSSCCWTLHLLRGCVNWTFKTGTTFTAEKTRELVETMSSNGWLGGRIIQQHPGGGGEGADWRRVQRVGDM